MTITPDELIGGMLRAGRGLSSGEMSEDVVQVFLAMLLPEDEEHELYENPLFARGNYEELLSTCQALAELVDSLPSNVIPLPSLATREEAATSLGLDAEQVDRALDDLGDGGFLLELAAGLFVVLLDTDTMPAEQAQFMRENNPLLRPFPIAVPADLLDDESS